MFLDKYFLFKKPVYPYGVDERITNAMGFLILFYFLFFIFIFIIFLLKGVSTLFLFANFQYLLLVFSFSIGKPFRKSIQSNCKKIIKKNQKKKSKKLDN